MERVSMEATGLVNLLSDAAEDTNVYRELDAAARALLDAGADLVFGSQAHQVQQMEFYNGKVILYGLGNFFFDQIHAPGVRQGYFMNLYFRRAA